MDVDLRPFATEIEELEPGQTIRVNHTECEAGEDTRRRLYITRPHSNEARVVAYCHNCQQTGMSTGGRWINYRDKKHATYAYSEVEHSEEEVIPPKGLIDDVDLWPTNAKSWYYSNKLTKQDIKDFGIAYDPSTDRVYLPRWDRIVNGEVRTLVGYQLRRLNINSKQPKYLTVQNKDASGYTFIHPAQIKCDYVVIVEDLVSAIHIINATEQDPNGGNMPGVYVNYGVKIDPTMMYNIARNYEYATVWLDNDSVHVLNQAKLMARTIAMYSDKIQVKAQLNGVDPKHYNHGEIRSRLDEVWNG